MLRLGVARPQHHGSFQATDRFVELAQRVARRAQQVERLGVGRVGGKDLAIGLFRAGQLPRSVKRFGLGHYLRDVNHEILPACARTMDPC